MRKRRDNRDPGAAGTGGSVVIVVSGCTVSDMACGNLATSVGILMLAALIVSCAAEFVLRAGRAVRGSVAGVRPTKSEVGSEGSVTGVRPVR
jgi:hypothetical protein